MKKTTFLLIVLIVLLLVCSCDHDIIGSRGPAGGWIFYDCDADNDETNDGAGPDGLKSSDCGWRYLEAAPKDITEGSTTGIVFGYYRTSSSGTNWYVNGSTTYVEGTCDSNDGKSTGTVIGTGKANTAKLVEKMGSAAYASSSGSDTTANYAAKCCDDYTYGGYSDWFLPSKDELNLVYENLSGRKYGLDTAYYWSSSEDEYFNGAYLAWSQYFGSGDQYSSFSRDGNNRVRAVRAFI